MDRFLAMNVFVAVAEAQGFAAAARRLGMSPPAVTRSVSALEQQLGVKLLQRTTRIVRLTESGKRYLMDCKRLLSDLEDAEQSLSGAHGELRGQLSLTASVMFGRLFVAPVLLSFLDHHPRVTGRAVLSDRIVDLIEEGVDVGVRIAHLSDASFTAVRVGAVREVVCASPAYLKAHGVPRVPQDVFACEAVTFSQDRAAPTWSLRAGKKIVLVRPRSRLIVNSSEVAIQAAVDGRGITRALSYMVAAEVKAGKLRIILSDFEPEPLPIHVIYHEGKRAAARVRSFVDFAVERLQTHPLLKA